MVSGVPRGKGKLKYEITVEPPTRNRHHDRREYCSLGMHKHFGNWYSSSTWAMSREEAIRKIKKMLKSWEEFDSILERVPDKPTPKNTHFESFTNEIRKPEIFGGSTLFNFVRG